MSPAGSAEFNQVIEADLAELFELRTQATSDLAVSVYIQVLIAYLQFDDQALNRLAKSFVLMPVETNGDDVPVLAALTRARLRIREKQVDEASLEELLGLSNPESDFRWAGEILFVLALMHDSLERYLEAKECYLRASRKFKEQGALRKSLKALLNSIASESKANSTKNFTLEYHWVAKKALQFGEKHVAGVAYNNISHEYHQMGANRVALKFSNQALRLLEDGAHGTINHYLAVIHRCHLLLQMGYMEEAELDYQYALVSPFPEIRAALSVVEELRGGSGPVSNASPVNLEHLTFNWKRRASEPASASGELSKLTPLEERLVALILRKPKSRMELVEDLYGKGVDPISAESRLKVLLSRLRKKRPGLLRNTGGKYALVPDLYPDLKFPRPA